MRTRPACARDSQRDNGSPGGRGPIRSPRRMSSFSVNARGHALGSVTAAYRRWSRVIASTRLGGGQVGCDGYAAAVRGDLDAVRGHDRDDFRVRRVSAAGHPGRAHRRGDAERGQSPREQRSRHRGPANIRRAQHDDAGLAGVLPLCMGGLHRPDAIYATHRNITGNFFSSAFNEDGRPAAVRRLSQICPAWKARNARRYVLADSRRESGGLPDFRPRSTCWAEVLNFTAVLVVHSPYGANAGSRRASGDFPAAATCRSERKS